jgi:hypothetical protein
MAISPEEFVKRLDAISEYKGVPYGRVHLLFDEEEKHGQATLQYKGYLALSDAFKCFFLETVELVNTECRPKVKTALSEFYPLFVPRLAHAFQSLCGAERVSLRGYPYHGYTLLRNVFDNLVLTSGHFRSSRISTASRASNRASRSIPIQSANYEKQPNLLFDLR